MRNSFCFFVVNKKMHKLTIHSTINMCLSMPTPHCQHFILISIYHTWRFTHCFSGWSTHVNIIHQSMRMRNHFNVQIHRILGNIFDSIFLKCSQNTIRYFTENFIIHMLMFWWTVNMRTKIQLTMSTSLFQIKMLYDAKKIFSHRWFSFLQKYSQFKYSNGNEGHKQEECNFWMFQDDGRLSCTAK